jgi:hypothetical protein
LKRVWQLTLAQRRELFVAAAQKLGYGAAVVEKDFWVCLTLRHLFTLPGAGQHLVFKGGTSLSKAWGAIRRFSEDVDVSLSREWLGFGGAQDPEQSPSKTKRKAQLEALKAASAAKIQTELVAGLRDRYLADLGASGWEVKPDAQDDQSLIFSYPSALGEPGESAYVRREVKVEGGARADTWPTENRVIRPYVAEAFPEGIADAQAMIKTLAIERTFWEKATILHVEALRAAGKATRSRYSRHYADLAVLADHEAGRRALLREDLRRRVVEHKRVFFAETGDPYATAVPGTFRLLPERARLEELERDYREMREMFFEEPPAWPALVERLRRLEDEINGTAGA